MLGIRLIRTRVATLIFVVCMLLSHPADARGPSTPEERAKVIELTRMLERDPPSERADATRQWLREWIAEVPEIRFHVCNELLEPGLENYPYSREIKLQTIFSGAVYTLERQDKRRDDVGAYVAGVEGALRMYEALIRSRPDARTEFLDGLVAMRDRGELTDHIARLAAEKCPSSNLLWIAATIAAVIGLGLASLVGWLFGKRRDDRLRESKPARRFALAALSIVLISAAYYVIVIAALHFLEPEYDPRYRFVSEYAWSPHCALMTTTFFVLALALFTVAVAVREFYTPTWSARLGFGLLVVAAVGICIAGAFRGFPLHDVGSAIGLTSVIMAAMLLSWSFRWTSGWGSVFPIAFTIAVGMLIAFVSMIMDVGMPGLQQRIFLFLILVWLSIVAHRLAKRPAVSNEADQYK